MALWHQCSVQPAYILYARATRKIHSVRLRHRETPRSVNIGSIQEETFKYTLDMRPSNTLSIILLRSLPLVISSSAQSGVQGAVTNNDASFSVGNITSAAHQVNTTSDGLQNSTWALGATGRDPECVFASHFQVATTSVASCEDAISQVPDTHRALLDPFGEQLQIPMRWSSCK